MARLRVVVVEGERVTLCPSCEAALGPASVPCKDCGSSAGGRCEMCGTFPTPGELARVPHAYAIGGYDEGTFGPRSAA